MKPTANPPCCIKPKSNNVSFWDKGKPVSGKPKQVSFGVMPTRKELEYKIDKLFSESKLSVKTNFTMG